MLQCPGLRAEQIQAEHRFWRGLAMPAALAAFHNAASNSCPPSPDICSTNARPRHILGSARKPCVVRARISVSCISTAGFLLAQGPGYTQGSDHPQSPTLNPPNVRFLPSDALQGSPQPRSHTLEGSGTSCSLPGGQGAAHGARCCCACPLLCTPRSLTPQGCVSPESADPSPAPGQRGQLKPSRRRCHGGNNAASLQRGRECAHPL